MPQSKTSKEFEKSYGGLNAPQKKAVDTIDGPVMVIAGPGTGKTTILTLRIANILRKTDTAPENILALTFTESGSYAMRRKLLQTIGPAAYRINIHTFHGFAENIIQEFPDYFPRIIGSTIITEAEQIKIIEKIIQSKEVDVLRPYGDQSYYVKSILNEIHILKRENVSPDNFTQSIRNDVRSIDLLEFKKTELEKMEKRNVKNAELAYVYKQYQTELDDKKYYDFDDMLLELIRAMEGNSLKNKSKTKSKSEPENNGKTKDSNFKLILQENYQYILADEHQDANAAQNRILELLSDFYESPNLFIVGDDKQAIYRFQGASLENFLYFKEKYKDAQIVELKHNYRSHQGILDASHSLIENNPQIPGRIRTKLVSLQVGVRPIFINEFQSLNDELEYVSSAIAEAIKKGEKPEEIAVLYRENREARLISDALRAHGIMHRIESDHNVLDDIDSIKIIKLSRAINDLSNSEYLAQALLLPEMKCDPAEVADLCNLSNREKIPLHQIIKQSDSISVKTAYSSLTKWLFDAQTLAFPEFLQKLIQETQMLASVVSDPNSLERLTSLEAFFDRIIKAAKSKDTFYIKDFVEYIDIINTHGLLTKRTYTEHVGGVRLMTAHRAKGLEFDHVFIVNVINGIWGNRTRRNLFSIPIIEHARDTGKIEDERRLFYVAMTRARESIDITYSRSNGEKETIPSQFISEINTTLVLFGKPVIANHFQLFEKKLKIESKLPSISILNQDYVKSKFLSQPFSVTHLNNYLACPWRYFFVNLIRIPQTPNKHQMFGTAIHAALRSFFDAYKEGKDYTKKQLIDLFKSNLDKQPLSVNDRKQSIEKGKGDLTGYYENYSGMWGRHLLTEYAIKGVELSITDDQSVKIQLTGKLDKIDFIDEMNVTVIDWKTSKPKSRNDIEGKTGSSDGNYKRQLIFYKLLSDGLGKFNMKYGEIDFISPNDRGIYKKESFEINDGDTIELRELIKKSATEIMGLSFLKSKCDDKQCEYCRLGKLLISEKFVD